MHLYCRSITIFAPCMVDTIEPKIHSVLLLLFLSRGGKHFSHMLFLFIRQLAFCSVWILAKAKRIKWAFICGAKFHFVLVSTTAVNALCADCFDGVLEISYRYRLPSGQSIDNGSCHFSSANQSILAGFLQQASRLKR